MKKLSSFKPNPKNPRTITDAAFETLKKNIKDFEKMMELRPIIVDKTKIVIGGNSKYRALVALGYTEVPDTWIKTAGDLTEEERNRFIMLDNHHAGKDDWDMIANLFDADQLMEWGIDIPDWNPPGQQVNFQAAPKTGLSLKVTFQNQEQAAQVVKVLGEIGITTFKLK